MHWTRCLIGGIGLLAVTAAASPRPSAIESERVGGVQLPAGVPMKTRPAIALADTAVRCFEGALTLALNPGCFLTPSAGGDCISHQQHLFIQNFVPTFATPHRIKAFRFISNDGSTVFPAAGVVVTPYADVRFPTPAELNALQVQNVPTAHDTAIVTVTLPIDAPSLVVTSGVDVWICLRFPEGGHVTAIGVGPAIIVDEVAPDPDCDFFTQDGGQSYFTNNRTTVPLDPLDWGFELIYEPVTAVTPLSWSEIKRLYGATRQTTPLFRAR